MPSASIMHWPRVPVTTARGRMSSTCAQLTGGSSSSRPRECLPPVHPRPLPPTLNSVPFLVPGLSLSFSGHILNQDRHPWTGEPRAQVPSGCAISSGAWSRCSPGSLASMWWPPCSLHPPSQLLLVPRRSSAALCCPALPPASLRYSQLCPPGQWDGAGQAQANYTQGYHV